jgi:vacuolar-type H+-ATPase subunit I/STV1
VTSINLDAIEARYFGDSAPWKTGTWDGPFGPDLAALLARVRELIAERDAVLARVAELEDALDAERAEIAWWVDHEGRTRAEIELDDAHDAEWDRLSTLTDEEVDAELRADGIDPKASLEKMFDGVVRKMAGQHAALRKVTQERDAALARAERAEAELARVKAECGRVYYHSDAQEDKVCRLPRGHAPGGRNQCEGEPPGEGDDADRD